jgi:hypothetical protein
LTLGILDLVKQDETDQTCGRRTSNTGALGRLPPLIRAAKAAAYPKRVAERNDIFERLGL